MLTFAGLQISDSSADAADLGGNCCADLEERIAELEATTARKGNRKVSLTVSGWVGQQVMWWDDGAESNVYVHDLGSSIGSHVKFSGQATILPGLTAGYVLHLEAISSDSLTINQDRADGPNALTGTVNGVSTLQSFWFVKSDQLGKVSVGKQSDPANHAAVLVDGSGSLVPANWIAFDFNSFGIRAKNRSFVGSGGFVPDASSSALVWGGRYCQSAGGALGDCDGFPRNTVRYDSPDFGGFSVSAAWGEDDIWSIATRYVGQWKDFKVAAVAAYFESTDENLNLGVSATQQYFQAGAYVKHIPTGLFAYGAYGHDGYDADDMGQSETYYLKGGIRQRWLPLGHTVLYGEYLHAHGTDEFSQSAQIGNGFDATEDATQLWGIGAVQEIDAAAMSIWVKYRHLNYDDNNKVGVAYDDFDYVGMGALINF